MGRRENEAENVWGEEQSEHQGEAPLTAGEPSGHAEPAPEGDSRERKDGLSGKEPVFQIRLSRALHKKLLSKAQMEGVSPQDLARELLAEGLVLRAWEIIERKNTMRSGNSQGSNNSYNQNGRTQNKQSYRNNSQNSGYGRNRQSNNYSSSGHGNNNRRSNFNHILEDSANFMEYVRSQEKKNS